MSMKKTFALVLAVMVFTVFAMPAFASTAGERFTDGLKTAVTSPMQIPKILKEK